MFERSLAIVLLSQVCLACSPSNAGEPGPDDAAGSGGNATPNMISDAGRTDDASAAGGAGAGAAGASGRTEAGAAAGGNGGTGGKAQNAGHGGEAGSHEAGGAGAGGRAAAGSGGASGRAAGGSGGSGGNPAPASGDCGDVLNTVAANHPVFKAIQRLATTKQEVRVLVYGQSISEQAWWSKTKQWLQDTYPNGNLVMEEHAHGGCSSQCLIGHEAYYMDNSQYNRLPEDVFAWKPDLIIFHVYGDHVDYGYIMKAFSVGCSAFDDYKTYDDKEVPEVHCTDEQRAMSEGYVKPEVLVQDDFYISDTQMDCPNSPTPDQWDCFMNLKVIPENVSKYQYTLQDNFHQFPEYIASHHLDPATLIMPDQTHLTEPAGTDVMFALTVPHLCYKQ